MKKKKLIVGYSEDILGLANEAPEYRIENHVKFLFRNFDDDFNIKFKFFERIEEGLYDPSLDIYAVDYGGLMLGVSGLVEHYNHEILKYIEDHPNTLLIFWTITTGELFEDYLEKEKELSPALDKISMNAPNVIVWGSKGCEDKLLQWMEGCYASEKKYY